MIDRNLLHESLQDFLAQYQNVRYRGIALCFPEERDLGVAMEILRHLLPDCRVWTKPGDAGSPALPCHRQDLLAQAFGPEQQDLLIRSPQEWMHDWTSGDRETFWNTLADSFGRHTTITVSLDAHELQEILPAYFMPRNLPACPGQVWISKHQPFVWRE